MYVICLMWYQVIRGCLARITSPRLSIGARYDPALMQVMHIEPVYYARDCGTGVALIRAEDKPPRGALIDFMRGHGVIKPGAIVPVCWQQIWDYSQPNFEIPTVFQWPDFKEWIQAWPKELAEFQGEWRRYFGMPGDDLADACIVIWEEPRLGRE
jgi:hypothetical protein